MSDANGQTGDWRSAPRLGEVLRHTSRKQRALLALAVVVPMALAALFSFQQRLEVLFEAEESAQRSVVALEQHAANVLDAHAVILRQLDILSRGRTEEQLRNNDILRATVSELSRELDQVTAIGITDANGHLIASSLATDIGSVSDRDYFQAHTKGTRVGIFVSEAFTGRESGQRQFALSIRRSLSSGEFGGVIFTSVPLDHFIGFWQGFTPSGGHLIPMVRPDGALIVRYPQTDSPRRLDPRGPFISRLTQSRRGLYTATSQVDGIERINAYTQVENYPLFVSFSVETREVLQRWREQVIVAASIAAVAVSLLVALWMAAVRQAYLQRLSAARWEAAARALQDEIARRRDAENSVREGAERLSFEEQLIGIVSHDLRNPLNTISLSAGAMARRDALGAQDVLLLHRIQNASQRAARLIRDLLDLTQARLGGSIPIQARPIDFHELLENVVAELDAHHPGRIVCSLEADDPRGEWDPDRIAQVVENLALNALKYGIDGGAVTITTRSDASSLVLAVHNTGLPIPAEKMDIIFEPLQRATGASPLVSDRSIGMGLFIVKHIVNAHGGSLDVASTDEGGTTFTVVLPRHPARP